MREKLKIGVLGASRGMDYIRRVLVNYEYAEIYALCETYSILCEQVKEELSQKGYIIECFTEFDDMINCGIDAVVLCNYANKHVDYAIKALKKGIHVLSESLPTQTVAEAVKLCEAVEESGCVYAYAENYCYFDTSFEMRRLYESGVIGEAVCIEGNFINDCSPRWHFLTRGDRNHWRNYVPSTFYCTHSIGPMLFASGLRGVSVNGFETPRLDYMAEKGARSGSAAMEILQLSNGAIAKSMNGNYRSEYQSWYRIIGTKGTIEANHDGNVKLIKYHTATGYSTETYKPQSYQFKYRPNGDYGNISNSDLAVFGFFVGAVLGDEESKKYTIDVYRALDMSLAGLLAYRSILDNGNTVVIPDFRNADEREKYRNDKYSTDPETEAEYLLPANKSGTPDVPDGIYEKVFIEFKNEKLTPGMK